MLRAGKEAIKRRKQFLHDGVSFGFETTFSGNSEKNSLIVLYKMGMNFILYI